MSASDRRWAPLLLLSPLPVAVYSLATVIGGNVVLLTAATECESINGDLVPQVGVLKVFLQGAVGLAYLFLLQYAWIFMGFNLRISPHIKIRGRVCGIKRKLRILRPFQSLRTIKIMWVLMTLASLGFAALGAAAMPEASFCLYQTPLLLAFTNFLILIYFMGFAIGGCRMAVLLFGHKVKKSVGSKVPNLGGKGYKKSVAGDDNDMEMVRKVFKTFDESGDGDLGVTEFRKFLDALGFSMDELEVQNLVVELDADNSGSINLEEFEVWYLDDKKKRNG